MSPHVCVVAPEMGASSTTTQARGPPISKWATINGMTSDGSPAFLPVADSTEGRHGLRHEKRIKHYILGRTKNSNFLKFIFYLNQISTVSNFTNSAQVQKSRPFFCKFC